MRPFSKILYVWKANFEQVPKAESQPDKKEQADMDAVHALHSFISAHLCLFVSVVFLSLSDSASLSLSVYVCV